MTVIAIDGPSGSGKSTLARRLAEHLGYAYLDTGAMYRAVCVWCLHKGVNLEDRAAVAVAAANAPLTMGVDPAHPSVHLAGVDITERIRDADIAKWVSHVATNLDVRAILRDQQREIIALASSGDETAGQSPARNTQEDAPSVSVGGAVSAERGSIASSDRSEPEPGEHGSVPGRQLMTGCPEGARGIVAEGRDITTVVAPDADIRILLIADPIARLERRAQERHGTSGAEELAATRDEVLRRDRDDSTVSEFMTAAEGVITLDNSNFTADETFAAALEIIARRAP